ncbi:uncharacterized protein LOC129225935 isoform X1 [Uloborus diversus]|uniref:uncharacterized protein LOC129225935 isoform X1 n=1 Tax=Uloborus diversus TaxID=327109 RepID=UPI00240A2527|nr:uncharacterized protein LOC129225935 isoform X1 [Uloborus diversus]
MVIVLEFRIPDFLHLTDTEESIRSLSDTQKMLKIIPLTLAVSFLALGPSMGEAASFATNLEKRGDIRLCGSMLVETLNVLCGGQYFDPNEGNSVRLNKRKDSSSWNDYLTTRCQAPNCPTDTNEALLMSAAASLALPPCYCRIADSEADGAKDQDEARCEERKYFCVLESSDE